MMKRLNLTDRKGDVMIEDPPIAKLLFSSTKLAWLWLVLRLWLGYEWLEAAAHKVVDPAWMANGSAVRAFWERAVTPNPATGNTPIVYGWYREFISLLLAGHHEVWFAKLVAIGELAIGLGLVLGAFVGIAAFFGGLMNWSYLMAGTVSTNPLLFAVTGLLILAWKTAGYYGLDRYLLPLLGTPWKQPRPEIETGTPKGRPPKRREMAYEPW
jgi:thiosulfate dehydrogenase (quinone) large subunit